MRKSIILAAVMVCGISAASAGDLAGPYYKAAPMPQSAYSWTGFYVGVDGGGAMSQDGMGIAGGNPLGVAVVGSGAVPNHIKTDPNGGLVGGFAGYNYQITPSIVLGIETDLQYANVNGGDNRILAFGPAILTTMGNSRLDWFGTTRGRVGYLLNPTVMVYGTGGVAYGGVNDTASIVLTTPFPGFSGAAAMANNNVQFGWAGGGGVDFAISNNINLRAEYLHMDLGTTGMTGTAVVAKTPVSFTASQAHTYDMARIGASYKLPY